MASFLEVGTMTTLRRSLLLFLFLFSSIVNSDYVCDDDAIHDDVKASRLSPNAFHKICPRQHSVLPLGQPVCGDGTSFSFFFSKPIQRKDNSRKLLIEFQGGGACWDSETCNMQSDALTFPSQLNDFVGLSCSEVQYGSSNNENDGSRFPVNMLCAQQLGDVDFTEYNTIVVPYCTQDVHLGDATAVYEQGETIQHRGAHNLASVLRWIFSNFQSPSHIALTGCSAGGTPLPVVYDLVNKHYTSFLKGGRSVQINVVSDSPVYLTPEYFLENALENWDPSRIMKRIGFNYRKNRYSTEYPTRVWDHVLKRGSNRDHWGLATHTSDPVSLQYFQWMSGNGDGENDNGNGDDYSTWWSELSDSLSTIQKSHHNVDTYIMNSEGHCSFGLYYALQYDDYFEEWASSVFQENAILGAAHVSVPLFVTSFLLGAVLAAGVLYTTKGKVSRPLQLEESALTIIEMKVPPRWKQSLTLFLTRFKSFPVTAGYFVTTTVYFLTMLVVEGFAHPINNPSLGPSAQGLSNFGINNPALIVYHYQFSRLISSNFLCSGILTYLMVVFCLWKQTRQIEEQMNRPKVFGMVSLAIIMGTNLVFAIVVDGASCASLPLVLGWNAFSISMNKINTRKMKVVSQAADANDSEPAESQPVVTLTESNQYSPPSESANSQREESSQSATTELPSVDEPKRERLAGSDTFPKPWVTTVLFTTLASVVFPFNSWVMLVTSIAIGFLAPLLFLWDTGAENSRSKMHAQPVAQLRHWAWRILGVVYFVMLLLLVFRVRKPDEKYEYPFLTGCELTYTTDVGDILSGYTGGNDNRYLGEEVDDMFEDSCAQFCIPYTAYRPARWVLGKFAPFSVDKGMCEENGYEVHVADKTFSALSYSLDVELYSSSGGERRI